VLKKNEISLEKLEFIFLQTGKRIEAEEGDIDYALGKINEYIEGNRNQTYPAVESSRCESCFYRERCSDKEQHDVTTINWVKV